LFFFEQSAEGISSFSLTPEKFLSYTEGIVDRRILLPGLYLFNRTLSEPAESQEDL
jgi:hypothetical protein